MIRFFFFCYGCCVINCVFVQSCLLLFARSYLDSDISKNQIFGTCLLLYSLHSIDSFKVGKFDLLTVESGTSDCLSGVPTSVKSSVFQSIKMGLWDWSIFFFWWPPVCFLSTCRWKAEHSQIIDQLYREHPCLSPSSSFCLLWIQALFFPFGEAGWGSICLHGPSALGLRPEKNEGRRQGGKKVGWGEDAGRREGEAEETVMDEVRVTHWDVEGGSKHCRCGYNYRDSGT